MYSRIIWLLIRLKSLYLGRVLHRCADIGALSEAGIEDLLAKAQMVRSYLKKLICVNVFNGLLQAHDPGRDKAERLVCAGRAGIGQVLGLTDIYVDVNGLAALSHDHAGVDFIAGADEELAALLGVEESVSDGGSGLKSDQGTLLAVGDISLIRRIIVKYRVHNSVALGICEEISSVTDQAAGRNGELKSCVAAVDYAHIEQLAFALAEFLDDVAREFLRDIDEAGLHRLEELAVFIPLIDYFRLTDREFVSLAAHGLDQNGQVEFSAAGYLE